MSHPYETIVDDVDDAELSSSAKLLGSLKYVYMFVMLIGVSFVLSSDFLKPTTTKHAKSTMLEDISTDLTFTFNRDGYSPVSFLSSSLDATLNYKVLSKYMGIIEPNVNNNMYVYNMDPRITDYTFKYTVCPLTDSGPSITGCSTGRSSTSDPKSIKFECSPFDEYEVKINQYYDNQNISMTLEDNEVVGYAVCMYVRRDIQSLSSTDLSTTLDAMSKMWSISEEEGQALYGEDFHSISYLTDAHMFHAAQRDSDHMNEGVGFLAQHVKLSTLFEKSLQSIDSSLTLPYWDFTAESGDLTSSFMFSADTFGSVVLPTDQSVGWTYDSDSMLDAAIPDGRWEKVESPSTDDEDLKNGFGYMRGPWNMNPTPYVSRFTLSSASLPTCSDYYTWLEMTDFTEFMATARASPFESISSLGSTFGCDKLDSLVSDGVINDDAGKATICSNWYDTLKELYRGNYISPKEDCVTGVFYNDGGIKCGFTCDDDDADEMITKLKKIIDSSSVPSDLSSDGWEKIRSFVCSGDGYRIFTGDLQSSSAPADPVFWPSTLNVERLLHAKMIGGGFRSVDWPKTAALSCEKSTCYEEDLNKFGEFPLCCKGHMEHDQMLDFVSRNKTLGFGYTNREIMLQTDAGSASYTMPYVYDSFTWSHCDSDFSALMESMAKS